MKKTPVNLRIHTRYFCLQKISKIVLTTLKLKKDEEKIHFINFTTNGQYILYICTAAQH